jgi:hypothetical protein
MFCAKNKKQKKKKAKIKNRRRRKRERERKAPSKKRKERARAIKEKKRTNDMVKKKEEETEDGIKTKVVVNAALKTRDHHLSSIGEKAAAEEEEEEDEEFMFSDMEKLATREEEKVYKQGPISNAQLKLYIDVLDKLCKEDKIEQFVKVFAPPDLEEEDRVYFIESLKGNVEECGRWERMKREIAILQQGKYRGVSGNQERGPVEFRFDMMVDDNDDDETSLNNNSKKKKNRGISNNNNNNSIHIMREVVFRKTNNVWHADG